MLMIVANCSQPKSPKVSDMLPSFEQICMGNSSVARIAESARREGWKATSYLDTSYFLWFKEQLSVKGPLLDFRSFEKAGLGLLLYRHQTRPNEKSAYKSVPVIGCDMIDMSGTTEIDDPTLEAAFGPLDDSKRTPALDSSGLVMRFWPKWVKDPSKRIIYMRDEKRGQNDLTSDPHQMASKAMLRSSWDEQK
jgi:hypothetical protein